MSEFDKAAKDFQDANKIHKVLNSPVVSAGLALASSMVVAAPIVAGTQEVVERELTNKRSKLIEIIMRPDEHILSEKIQNVDFLIEFSQLIECVTKTRSEDKIVFLGKLFRNAIYLPLTPDYDEYEEFRNRLMELSYREIHILHVLSNDRSVPDWQREAGESKKDNILWEMFLDEASVKTGLNKELITALVSGISRTGFCKQKVAPDRGKNKIVYEVTPYFERLKALLNE